MIVVSDIILNINSNTDDAIIKAQKVLGLSQSDIIDSFIIKSSIDARHRKEPQFVCSVGFITSKDEKKIVEIKKQKNISYREIIDSDLTIKKGTKKLESRPIIVGFGPAGMFAGLLLAKNGYNPIIIERGADIDTMTLASFGQAEN